MGLIKRRPWDNNGISPLVAVLFWPGIASMIGALWYYETNYAPIVTSASTSFLGMDLEGLWVIVALIAAGAFLIWIIFGQGVAKRSS